MQVRITYEHEATAKAKEGTYEERQGVRNGVPVTIRIRPVGMVIDEVDQPDCWKLVSVGLAEPHDDECKARFTPAQVAFAQENGHARFMAVHQEARQEVIDKAVESEFVEPEDEGE